MRIILASDTEGASRMLDGLGSEGIGGDLAEPFEDVGSITQHSGPYDVVLLHVRTVRGPACAALRDLRGRGIRTPVLILGERVSPDEEQEVLNLGADDVHAQPIGIPVLAARLRAMHRRAQGHASSVLVCGNVTLDQGLRQATVDGRRAMLTAREFQVLEMLMVRRNMVLSKEHFMSRLCGDREPDYRILDVFVCKLRRKLAAVGAAEIIRTAWGLGYVVEEPTPAALAAARARYAAGEPRRHRAHLHQARDPRLVLA